MTNPFEGSKDHGNDTSETRSLVPLEHLDIPASFRQLTVPGISVDPHAHEAHLNEDNLVFVGMNSAAYAVVPPETVGQVYTRGLAGCTGIAGVAEIDDGAIAGVSHFDPVVDARQRQNGVCPSEQFIFSFINAARKRGAQSIKLLVLYDSLQKTDPNYGKFGDNYDDWHFIDQLESLMDEPEEDVSISFESYEGMGTEHILTANVGADSSLEILHN